MLIVSASAGKAIRRQSPFPRVFSSLFPSFSPFRAAEMSFFVRFWNLSLRENHLTPLSPKSPKERERIVHYVLIPHFLPRLSSLPFRKNPSYWECFPSISSLLPGIIFLSSLIE